MVVRDKGRLNEKKAVVSFPKFVDSETDKKIIFVKLRRRIRDRYAE